MSGQAHALAQLAWSGSRVHLSDVNPSVLLLAALRSPDIIADRNGLCSYMAELIRDVDVDFAPIGREFHRGWLHASVAESLGRFARTLGSGRIWDAQGNEPPRRSKTVRRRLFGLGIAVLAARDLCTYGVSDNLTWLRPGGMLGVASLSDALTRALRAWRVFADEAGESIGSRPGGSVYVRPRDITVSGSPCSVEMVVTSPPYANRLDYTRLWAPECAVGAAVLGVEATENSQQIGSNVVSRGGERVETAMEVLRNRLLAPSAKRALLAILRDGSPYSDTYYFPFFASYAAKLLVALEHVARSVDRRGAAMVFVRDTVRKDILFPTGELVSRAMSRGYGFRRAAAQRRIIRRHVGYRRKGSAIGLMGLAQQEWWFLFVR